MSGDVCPGTSERMVRRRRRNERGMPGHISEWEGCRKIALDGGGIEEALVNSLEAVLGDKDGL